MKNARRKKYIGPRKELTLAAFLLAGIGGVLTGTWLSNSLFAGNITSKEQLPSAINASATPEEADTIRDINELRGNHEWPDKTEVNDLDHVLSEDWYIPPVSTNHPIVSFHAASELRPEYTADDNWQIAQANPNRDGKPLKRSSLSASSTLHTIYLDKIPNDVEKNSTRRSLSQASAQNNNDDWSGDKTVYAENLEPLGQYKQSFSPVAYEILKASNRVLNKFISDFNIAAHARSQMEKIDLRALLNQTIKKVQPTVSTPYGVSTTSVTQSVSFALPTHKYKTELDTLGQGESNVFSTTNAAFQTVTRPRARPAEPVVRTQEDEKEAKVRTATDKGRQADSLNIGHDRFKVVGIFKLPNLEWLLLEKSDGSLVKVYTGSIVNNMKVESINENFVVFTKNSQHLALKVGTIMN